MESLTVKLSIAGGTSSPSTIIWFFSRILAFCASVRSRIYRGGRHLNDESPVISNAERPLTMFSLALCIVCPSPIPYQTQASVGWQSPPTVRFLPLQPSSDQSCLHLEEIRREELGSGVLTF